MFDVYREICYHIDLMRKIVIFLILIFLFVSQSFADKLLFKLTDPTGDDHGPGSYLYPKNTVFKDGSFDLTGFEVYESDSDLIFKIYFKNRFLVPPDLQLSNNKNLKDLFKTNLYLQNIDIYIDTDHKYNSGIVDLISGRNAKVLPDCAWENAIFISPQPYLARSEMKRLAKKLVDKVNIPNYYDVKDNYVQVKVPKKSIGQPTQRWGYLVLVTGAEWENSMFSLSNWMNYGSTYEEPVLNRIVEESASEWEFGGGDKAGAAPNIIDMFVASTESQEKMLGAYDAKTRKRAVVSAIYPFPSTLEVEKFGTAEVVIKGAKVIDVLKNVLVIDAGSDSGVFVGKLGQVYDGNGNSVSTIIVEEVKENMAICTIIPLTQTDDIAVGMEVRFK